MKTFRSLFALAAASLVTFAGSAEAAETNVKGVRIGGFLGDKVLLVLPDRSASLVKVGDSVRGIKLAAVNDTSATLESQSGREVLDLTTAWQLAPHADLTSWYTRYLKLVGRKIDAQNPEVNRAVAFRAYRNGAVQTDDVEVTQGMPYPKLPGFLDAVSLTVNYAPERPAVVQMGDMFISEKAYDRLLKAPYAQPALKQAQSDPQTK